MSPSTKTRLISLAIGETVIALVMVFVTTNPAIFAVIMLGVPFALVLVCAPIVLLIRSKKANTKGVDSPWHMP